MLARMQNGNPYQESGWKELWRAAEDRGVFLPPYTEGPLSAYCVVAQRALLDEYLYEAIVCTLGNVVMECTTEPVIVDPEYSRADTSAALAEDPKDCSGLSALSVTKMYVGWREHHNAKDSWDGADYKGVATHLVLECVDTIHYANKMITLAETPQQRRVAATIRSRAILSLRELITVTRINFYQIMSDLWKDAKR